MQICFANSQQTYDCFAPEFDPNHNSAPDPGTEILETQDIKKVGRLYPPETLLKFVAGRQAR